MRNGCIAVIILMLPGCAGQDVIIQKQTEMESRLERLIQDNKSLAIKVAGLSAEVKELNDQVQNHSGSIQELKQPALTNHSEGKEAYPANRLPQLKQSPATKIELINDEMPSKEENKNASDLYMKAFGLYSANNYAGAVKAFKAFLKKYPATEYAVNAQYWLGECYYSQSDMPRALEAFRQVVEKYPDGTKAPDALLKIGYTLIAMKEPAKARVELTGLIEKYPDSPAAAKARERLDNM